MSKLLSIIIPNFNYSKYLGLRFNSIINQSFKDYEIIFLDDASSDNSVEIFRKKYETYTDKVIVNKNNSGSPFSQWNKGVQNSTGKYIWIAEADDYCENNFLEELIPYLENNDDIGIVFCNTAPINHNGVMYGNYSYLNYLDEIDTVRWTNDYSNDGNNEVENYFYYMNIIANVSGVIIRRDAFIGAGYAPVDYRNCGDWLTYVKILKRWKIAYCSKLLNYHRMHDERVTNNSVSNLIYFKEFLKVQKYIKTNFTLSKDAKKKSIEKFIIEWTRLQNCQISITSNIRLFFISLSYYPKYFFKLAFCLIKIIGWKCKTRN